MKKLLVVLTIALLIATPMTTYASNPNGVSDIFEISKEEIESSLKQRAKVLNGISSKNSFYNLPYYYKVLNVPVFEQPKDYYCGPATTKQIVHYLNGSSPNMETIAKSLNTEATGNTLIGNIRKYLNLNTTKSYEIEWDTRDYYTWENQIKYGMENNKPAVLLVKPSTSLGFPYNSNGHYVNSSGLEINTGGLTPDSITQNTSSSIKQNAIYTKVRVTDPWGPGLGNRWYDARDVWQAIRNHEHKAMLY